LAESSGKARASNLRPFGEAGGYWLSRAKLGRPPARLRRFGAQAGATYSASR
jgi:hypothetical protein